MAEPKNDDFLDDVEEAEAEAFAEEMDEVDEEALEIEQLRAERDELKDRFMRALADAENARKRSDRDRREAENYGGSKLSRDMLPVYDNLKRGLDAVTDEQKEEYRAELLDQVLHNCVKDMVKQINKARRDPVLKRDFTDVFVK